MEIIILMIYFISARHKKITLNSCKFNDTRRRVTGPLFILQSILKIKYTNNSSDHFPGYCLNDILINLDSTSVAIQ